MKIERTVDTEVFIGKVTYDIPLYAERTKLLKELSLRTDSQGNVVADQVERSVEDLYDYSEKLADVALKYVSALSLKCKSEDEVVQITQVEELLCYEEGIQLVGFFANTILGGIKLGNDSKKI